MNVAHNKAMQGTNFPLRSKFAPDGQRYIFLGELWRK